MSRGREPVPGAGLCNSCRHQQIVRTTRGSLFSLCLRSRVERPDGSRAGDEANPDDEQPAQRERFPRYPRLPVTSCPGYEPEPTTEAAD
jgi:hypothetical protein